MTFTVTDMTVENQQRAYLFDTINGLDVGSIDGLAVLAGNSCQVPVPNLPDGSDPNTTTDGRTSQAWTRGPTRWLADVSRGVIENADMQVPERHLLRLVPAGRHPHRRRRHPRHQRSEPPLERALAGRLRGDATTTINAIRGDELGRRRRAS